MFLNFIIYNLCSLKAYYNNRETDRGGQNYNDSVEKLLNVKKPFKIQAQLFSIIF